MSNAQRYMDEVMKPYILPYIGQMKTYFLSRIVLEMVSKKTTTDQILQSLANEGNYEKIACNSLLNSPQALEAFWHA